MNQSDKLLDLLQDYKPHNTLEILEKVYGVEHSGIARISARVLDLKKKGFKIKGWKDDQKQSIYWYQLKPVAVKELFNFVNTNVGNLIL